MILFKDLKKGDYIYVQYFVGFKCMIELIHVESAVVSNNEVTINGGRVLSPDHSAVCAKYDNIIYFSCK